ncbi:hypothetical protein BSKO_05326 [Bryopsis sp. KO-2023]|nr:hypothetical protein BSKO_05326 [Bryopsis sp. KO-2023]
MTTLGTVDWSPEGVPYQSPSKMKSTDATAEGAWIDVLLQTIVQHVPKDELKTILETGRVEVMTSVVDGVEIHLGKLKNVVEDLGGGDEGFIRRIFIFKDQGFIRRIFIFKDQGFIRRIFIFKDQGFNITMSIRVL